MRNMRWNWNVVAWITTALLGCGGDLRGTCNLSGPTPACIEYHGTVTDEDETGLRALCPGSWSSDQPCSPSGRIGGCKLQVVTDSGSRYVEFDWYYGAGVVKTVDDVIARCMRTGATFLAP